MQNSFSLFVNGVRCRKPVRFDNDALRRDRIGTHIRDHHPRFRLGQHRHTGSLAVTANHGDQKLSRISAILEDFICDYRTCSHCIDGCYPENSVGVVWTSAPESKIGYRVSYLLLSLSWISHTRLPPMKYMFHFFSSRINFNYFD